MSGGGGDRLALRVVQRFQDIGDVHYSALGDASTASKAALGILCHSASAMVESDLEGYWRGGMCDPTWQEAFGKARRAGSDGFSPLLEVWTVLGKYLKQRYCSVYYSKAQNYRLEMARLMDRALADADILVSPATPMKAIKLVSSIGEGTWEGRGAIDMTATPVRPT